MRTLMRIRRDGWMGDDVPQSAAERRRQKARELKEQRIRAAKQRKALKIGVVGVVGVLVAGFLVYAGIRVFDEQVRSIPGVEEWDDLSNEHVAEPPDYEMSPPAGGPHFESWQNCGVYDEPVADFLAVHSLEHGAVWITYDPDEVSDDEVGELEGMYNPGDYLIISPYLGEMPGPIAASGWGRQIVVDSPGESGLSRFVTRYEQSNDVPEPGAACSGAIAETAEELEAQGFPTGTPGIEPAEDAEAEGADDEAADEDEEDAEDTDDE
jgi:hypothetical protein